MRSAILVSLILVLVSATAAADEDQYPDLVTLDRTTGTTRAGVEFGFYVLDTDADIFLMRTDFFATLMHRSGFGGYIALPTTYGSVDEVFFNDEEFAAGNLDLGGLYHFDLEDSPVGITTRIGLALPTADDNVAGIAVNEAALPGRLTDRALIEPDTTWLRLGVSPTYRQGLGFFRADLRLDAPLNSDNDADLWFAANLAGGADLGVAVLAAELVNIGTTEDNAADQFFHTLAFSGRFRTEHFDPYMALVFPLDENIRDNVDLVILVGVNGKFEI